MKPIMLHSFCFDRFDIILLLLKNQIFHLSFFKDFFDISPVSSHQHKGVNRNISCDIDDVLNSAAPENTERPVHEDVVAGGERNTDEDEQKISNCEVENQQVGRVLHLRCGVNLGKKNLLSL